MRRASLVAPLLLIGVGILFLARNVFPEMQLLDYLAKYWPLLLVVWGGLRLLEILFWTATGRPLPPFGISSGECPEDDGVWMTGQITADVSRENARVNVVRSTRSKSNDDAKR